MSKKRLQPVAPDHLDSSGMTGQERASDLHGGTPPTPPKSCGTHATADILSASDPDVSILAAFPGTTHTLKSQEVCSPPAAAPADAPAFSAAAPAVAVDSTAPPTFLHASAATIAHAVPEHQSGATVARHPTVGLDTRAQGRTLAPGGDGRTCQNLLSAGEGGGGVAGYGTLARVSCGKHGEIFGFITGSQR